MDSATALPTSRAFTARLLAWLALAGCAVAQATPSEPVDWASRDLEIPYRWSGSTGAAASVVLYSSSDGGQTWQRAGAGLPHVRSFRFKAPSDGEYWFALRTYDRAGRPKPAGPLGPEMRVRVDTAAPAIGRVDARLDGQTLRVALDATDTVGFHAEGASLYARADGRPGWLPIPVTRAQPSADGRAVRLEGEWLAPPNAKQVEVRAIVADPAGNRAEQSAVAVAAAGLPASQPLIGRTAQFPMAAGAGTLSPGTSGGAVDPFAIAERRSPATAPAYQQPSGQPPRLAQAAPRRPRPQAPAATPWPAELPKTRSFATAAPQPPPTSPFGQASFRAKSPGSFDEVFNDAPPISADAPQRLVNGAEFEFDYELEDTGRWGVGKIELWGTDNGGRSWRRFAIDSDRQSPIHVRTPGEGTYGFRLVVEPVGGLEAPTPRPGDAPEAVVVVDLQKPRAVLTGVRQGEGYFADQLIIEWRVSDEHLVERPIDLFYSNRPSGPWIPVATGLPNSGRHAWRLQRHLPRRPYLKLEARDEAGNAATAITPEPVTIDMPTAGGSLRGVRAAGR